MYSNIFIIRVFQVTTVKYFEKPVKSDFPFFLTLINYEKKASFFAVFVHG